MNKEQLPILTWDTCQITEDEVKYRLENKEDFELTDEDDEDSIRENVYESYIYADRWSDMVQNLSEIMEGLAKRNYYKNR